MQGDVGDPLCIKLNIAVAWLLSNYCVFYHIVQKYVNIAWHVLDSSRNGFATTGSDRDIMVDFRAKGLGIKVSENSQYIYITSLPKDDA